MPRPICGLPDLQSLNILRSWCSTTSRKLTLLLHHRILHGRQIVHQNSGLLLPKYNSQHNFNFLLQSCLCQIHQNCRKRRKTQHQILILHQLASKTKHPGHHWHLHRRKSCLNRRWSRRRRTFHLRTQWTLLGWCRVMRTKTDQRFQPHLQERLPWQSDRGQGLVLIRRPELRLLPKLRSLAPDGQLLQLPLSRPGAEDAHPLHKIRGEAFVRHKIRIQLISRLFLW